MKFCLYIATISLLLFAGCKSEKQKLSERFSEGVESVKKQLPMRYVMGTIDDIAYHDSKVTIVGNLVSPYDKIVMGSETIVSPKLIAANLIGPFKSEAGLTTEQIRTLGLCYEIIYKNGNGQPIRTISISTEDLCEVSDRIENRNGDKPLYSKDFYLSYLYESNKPLLPMEIDEYTTFTDIDISGGTVDYKYTLTTLPVSLTDNVKKAIRQSIVDSTAKIYRSIPIILHDWTTHEIVFNYTYYSQGGEEVLSFSIEAKELEDATH